jgi:hypothetical protein
VDTLGRGTEYRCHGSVAAKMSQQALSVPMGHASDLATVRAAHACQPRKTFSYWTAPRASLMLLKAPLRESEV